MLVEGRASALGMLGLLVMAVAVAGAAIERVVALALAYPERRAEEASGAAVVLTVAMAALWLAQLGLLPEGPLLPLVALALALGLAPFGAWVPVVLGLLGLLHVVVSVDAIAGNLDQGGITLPIMATAWLVVSGSALVAAALIWTARTQMAEERAA